MMRSGYSLVFGLAAGCLCGQARAEQPIQSDPYAAGVECFEQLDYPCAVDLLTTAAFAGADLGRATRIDIFGKLAESHLALGQRDKAVEAFARLLEIDPTYRIAASGTSPKILEALDEARTRRRDAATPPPRGARAEQAVEPARQGQPSRPLRLGLAGGAELLVGQDSRWLEVGPAIDLELLYRFSDIGLLGAGLRWSSHGLSREDSTLHLVAGWAGAGLGVDLGPVFGSGVIGLGTSRFGLLGREGRTALLLPLCLTVGVDLYEGFGLGLRFSPSWVLTLGDFRSSLTLDLSIHTMLSF